MATYGEVGSKGGNDLTFDVKGPVVFGRRDGRPRIVFDSNTGFVLISFVDESEFQEFLRGMKKLIEIYGPDLAQEQQSGEM